MALVEILDRQEALDFQEPPVLLVFVDHLEQRVQQGLVGQWELWGFQGLLGVPVLQGCPVMVETQELQVLRDQLDLGVPAERLVR